MQAGEHKDEEFQKEYQFPLQMDFCYITIFRKSFGIVNNTVKQIQTRSLALSVVLTPVKS